MANKNLVFSHRGGMGDFLLTWPVLKALRNKFNSHRFFGLGRPSLLRLAKKFNLVETIHDCESKDLLPFYQGIAVPAFLQPLDIALSWSEREPAFERLLQKHCTGKYLLHPPFPTSGNRHVSEHHGDILSAFDIDKPDDWDYYFPIPSPLGRTILIHPGSGSPDKNFEPDFYLFLADEIINSGFENVKFILGPAEAPSLNHYSSKYEVLNAPDLCALADVISGCSLYIGNDSGPSHLAGLLGVRTLVIFKSTSPLTWGVKGLNAVNFEAPTATLATSKILEYLSSL